MACAHFTLPEPYAMGKLGQIYITQNWDPVNVSGGTHEVC